MDPKIKKYLTYLLVATPFLMIGTCNYYINTHQENAIITDPKPGDYLVFRGLIGNFDQPFKVKKIAEDSIYFFVPNYELMDFQLNKSESKVYELEEKGVMYDSSITFSMARSTVDSLAKNNSLSVRLDKHPSVSLRGAFGKSRGNKVDETLEKLVEPKKKLAI
jgi:hypothetical protein